MIKTVIALKEGLIHISAMDGAETAGVLELIPRNDHLLVHLFCVSSRYRGQGIGKLLMDSLPDVAKEHGVSEVRVCPSPEPEEISGKVIDLASLYAVYSRLGFVFTEDDPDQSVPGLEMVKRL